MPSTISAVAGSNTPDPGGLRAAGATGIGLNGEALVWTGAIWQLSGLQPLVSGDGNGIAQYAAKYGAAIAKAMRLAPPASVPAVPETVPTTVAGTIYYIDPLDPAASDAGTGQSRAAPWANLSKISGLNPGVGAVIYVAADAVFDYVQTWTAYKAYNTAGLITFDNLRGTITQPITIKPYYPRAVAAGTKPIVRWYADTVAGDWTQEAGNGGKIWSLAWSRSTAITREMQVYGGVNREIMFNAPGQDSNLPSALSMENQFVADGTKLYVWVPTAANPVTYYGRVCVTGGNAVFQTFWNGGHYLKIYGLRFEDCYPMKLSYASSGATDVKGFEMAYCEFYRTVAIYLRNSQTDATAREFETLIHDCDFYSLPHSGIRHSITAGTAGNTQSWQVYRNRVFGANLSASYGGGLLYNQAIGGTKHHAWGNYGYDCRNGAGEAGARGAGSAQIDGCFIYFDIGSSLSMAWGNIAERCGVGYQSNRAIKAMFVANLAIDCGSFSQHTASAGAEDTQEVYIAHNTWLWTGRIAQEDLQRGPNIGGDTVGLWSTWPVFETSNQQYSGGLHKWVNLVFANNLAVNASGTKLALKPMFRYPETRITTLTIAGNACAGLADTAVVDKDSTFDRTTWPRYMAVIGSAVAGRGWVADYANGIARPALGAQIIGAGEVLSLQYQDIGGRNFVTARPTIGCYEVEA